MTHSRILSAGLIATALLIAPVSSALADGPRWSHGGGTAPRVSRRLSRRLRARRRRLLARRRLVACRGGCGSRRHRGRNGRGALRGDRQRGGQRGLLPPPTRRLTTPRSSTTRRPQGYNAPQQYYAPRGNAPAVLRPRYRRSSITRSTPRSSTTTHAQPAPTYAPPARSYNTRQPRDSTTRRRRSAHVSERPVLSSARRAPVSYTYYYAH